MKLSEIIRDTDATILHGNADTEITSLCSDSRKVTPGSLFFAVKGYASDGHAYIPQALEKGAAAVVDGSRKAVALAADAFYGHPSGKLTLVGITGTNGKTTTVTLLYNLFRSLGYPCGLLSTIANYVDDERLETENTTVDPITLNSLLARMVDKGCEYCFMEVSSIGVEQDRVTGLEFKLGIFSNLTHDHLDYHKTFAEYLRCKKLFFDMLPESAIALINDDDRNGRVMVQNTKAQVVTYAVQGLADHTARILEQNFDGMLLKIDGTDTWCRLIGRHNAYNLLAIYSAAVSLGADPTETLVALSRLESAPGRLENLNGPRDLSVIVDYAHTPDALENVLTTLRDIAPERTLVCLFGCGGDRDKTKRPEMAQVAQKKADRIIITSDNPRTRQDPGHPRPPRSHPYGHPHGTGRRHHPAGRQGARDLPDYRPYQKPF